MKKKLIPVMLMTLLLLLAAGCGADNSARITVSGDGIDGELSYSMNEMSKWENSTYSAVYSYINNWPSKKFAYASGITLESILRQAGVWDSFSIVTVAAADGYSYSFTREQVMADRFYYPGLLEGSEEAKELRPFILTTDYAADSEDAADMEPEELPRLVFGQSYLNEHNSVAFVENVASVTVSNAEPEQLEAPGIFPENATVAKGETVKLTHDMFGLLKIFYTLDGSEPDVNSAMYNPSTYQPKLNAPISIEADTVIKAKASTYGYRDSETVTFEVKVK